MPFFESERAGVLIARLTSDVQTLTTFTRHVLIEVVGSILLLVLTGIAIVLLSPVLAAVVLVSFPLIVVSALSYQRRSHPSYLSLRERVGDTMTSLQEGLTGVRVVKAYGREQEQFEQYRDRSRAQVRAWRRISLVNISFFSVISFAQALSSAAVVLVGGWLYWRGETTIGTVVAISLYLFSLFDPIGRLGDWLSQFQSGRAALTKLVALLETPVDGARRRRRASGGRRAASRAADVRLRRRARAARRLADGATGRAARARRADGRGEVDAREAAHPPVRPDRRRRAARRRRPARGDARLAPTADRLPAAGGAPLLRHARRQRAARAAGRERRAGRGRAAPDRRARALRSAAERAPDRRAHARRAAVVGRAAARRARPRRARRPDGDRARRGDVVARPGNRGTGRARAHRRLARAGP